MIVIINAETSRRKKYINRRADSNTRDNSRDTRTGGNTNIGKDVNNSRDGGHSRDSWDVSSSKTNNSCRDVTIARTFKTAWTQGKPTAAVTSATAESEATKEALG